MVIFFLFVLNRGRVDDVVIIRIVQSAIHFQKDRFQDSGEFFAIIRSNRAEGGLMLFGAESTSRKERGRRRGGTPESDLSP